MKQEPRKHHYIPQFILRNFCDENNQVNYWDIKSRKLEARNTRSIFMNRDMYRDEQLNSENPTQIESKFSIFEREIAELIANKKMVVSNEITLTRSELEKLRIFTTLLSFRSDLRMKQYEKSFFDESTKEILLKYQPDGNFESLWKRELNTLADCRTNEQINASDDIDPIIKTDFQNDLEGYFITFIEARGGQFLLSDIYPTLEIFPMLAANIHMHYIFPLSSTRAMLLNHIMFRKENFTDPMFKEMVELSRIKGDAITPPKNKYANGIIFTKEDKFVYKVKKIYAEDVEYINALILNEARVGIMFQDAERIINSISAFNLRRDTKQKYLELENILSME